MGHIEKLEKYLTDKDKGYLLNEISDNKIIMLSGTWGSGKTYFWKNTITKILNDDKKKIPNHYISLYGKTSIQEIKNEIFIKIFESVDSSIVEEKSKKLAQGTLDLVSSFTKSINIFGLSVDLSKLTDKSFENLDSILKDKKFKKTEEYLNSGAIICFDDFERKSKDIDLNDLFGFITQLTLNFKCKVVIILNSDVFIGEDKKVFTNVKEKSISKYLSFAPTSKELFNMIFDEYKETSLKEHKDILKRTVEEVDILNARIFIQVFDNILEWIESDKYVDEKTLRLLILVNINFILNHYVYWSISEKYDRNEAKRTGEAIASSISEINNTYPIKPQKYGADLEYKISYGIKDKKVIPKDIYIYINNSVYDENIIENLKYAIDKQEKQNTTKSGQADKSKWMLEYVDNNIFLIQSFHFMNCFKISSYCSDDYSETSVENFNHVNNFIEIGIM